MRVQVSVVIPAHNEEERIPSTLDALFAQGLGDEIIVVDDGSTDSTARVSMLCGARVVSLQSNRGKGYALMAGIGQARGRILLLLDADLADSAARAGDLLAPVLRGELDMTIAVFPRKKIKAGLGLAVNTARCGIRLLTGAELAAPLSGQRALRREVVDSFHGLGWVARGFGFETALTIDALRNGFRVGEVAVDMTHRVTGRDFAGFIHRGRQLCAVTGVLLSRALSGAYRARGVKAG